MKLRLREDRNEWLKTNVAVAVVVVAALWQGERAGWWSLPSWGVWGPGVGLVAAAGMSRAWARWVYRKALTIGWRIGRVVSWWVLTAIFLVLVVPTGWLLRWSRHDPLRLRDQEAESWWDVPSGSGEREYRF